MELKTRHLPIDHMPLPTIEYEGKLMFEFLSFHKIVNKKINKRNLTESNSPVDHAINVNGISINNAL